MSRLFFYVIPPRAMVDQPGVLVLGRTQGELDARLAIVRQSLNLPPSYRGEYDVSSDDACFLRPVEHLRPGEAAPVAQAEKPVAGRGGERKVYDVHILGPTGARSVFAGTITKESSTRIVWRDEGGDVETFRGSKTSLYRVMQHIAAHRGVDVLSVSCALRTKGKGHRS